MRFAPFLALIALSSPCFAQNSAVQKKEEKKICRRAEAPTGSIMAAKPTCHTKSEWASIDEGNRSSAGRMLDQNRDIRGARDVRE